MSTAIGNPRCSKADCAIATSGLCAEGHSPALSCPFYDRLSATADPTSLDEAGDDTDMLEGEPEEEQIHLPLGEALTPDEVDEFLRWRSATFVTIVGDRECGKTTLICAIYDRFLKGPFADHIFAGSRTLMALEERSHYARAESGRAHPETPHTSIAEGLRFFHFAAVSAGRIDARSDLLLSDRAGESYSRARDNSALVGELIEVEKADRLVLLLDGGRVVEPVERAGAVQAVRQTLRAFLDGGALNGTSIVQVVTTKIDLLADHDDKADIDRQLALFRQRLATDFAPRLAELSFRDIAARDPRGGFAPAFGVDALFADWIMPRTVIVARAGLPIAPEGEFDRLLQRTPMEVLP